MKPHVVAVALVLVLSCGPSTLTPPSAASPASPATSSRFADLDEELRAEQLDANTYVVSHRAFFDSNVLVARMPDGTVVFCSSPFETQATRRLVQWAKATLFPTRMVAINTHFHFDGSGGNEAYHLEGVQTYSSALTRDLLLQRGEGMKQRTADEIGGAKGERLRRMALVPAQHTFDATAGLVLTFGGEEVRVMFPGPAHSPDNLWVYFPARRTLFGGCMIRATRAIGNTSDADVGHWAEGVRKAFALSPRVVIPGHGAIGGPELLEVTLGALADAPRK